MGIIRRNFCQLSERCLVTLYKSMVRPILEYAQSAWSPHLQADIELIERVQMRATKLIRRIKNLPYEIRLQELQLPTLKFRRIRGDMIEMYKIVSGTYDSSASITPVYSNTQARGHQFKLFQNHIVYDLRKFAFRNRVIQGWNSLTEDIVSAESLNVFKNRLDRYWCDQEVKFNFKAELSGTGNRSIKSIREDMTFSSTRKSH